MIGDTPPPLRKGLRVAMRASRRDLVAARNGIPGRLGPLDRAAVGHDVTVLARSVSVPSLAAPRRRVVETSDVPGVAEGAPRLVVRPGQQGDRIELQTWRGSG